MSHREDLLREAEEKREILDRAAAFAQMIQTPGWKILYGIQEASVEKARHDLRKVDTSNHSVAIDAMQRWQIAENMLELQANVINSTLENAKTIRGAVTVEEALLMEQLNEQSKPTGDSGGRSDTAGY